MLRFAQNGDENSLLPCLEADAFAAKAGGLIRAYGCGGRIIDVWYGGEKDDASCVIVRLDGNVSLWCNENCDFEETAEFLQFIGYERIFCDSAVMKKLGLTLSRSCAVMKCGGIEPCGEVEEIGENIREMYDLICECIPGSFTEEGYMPFLSDFTYRRRRGLARAKCICEDGKIVACALVSSYTNKDAVISGVACNPLCRGKGYAKRVVSALVNELLAENKNVYVFVLDSKARGFYEKIGFIPCGEWSET